MDILHISVILLVLLSPSLGLDDGPLEVKFDNSTQLDVLDGAENIKFICIINKGPLYVISNDVLMVHVDPVSGSETIISSAGQLKEGKPDFYDIKIDELGSIKSMRVNLTILKVRYQDDGKIICRVGPDKIVAEREIVVHRPIKTLKLQFADHEPILETPSDANDAIKTDHGTYNVLCIAEGSSPATEDVHLYLHGLMVPHDKPVVEAMDVPERKFRTTLTGKVDIMLKNSGQELECQAEDSTGMSLSTKIKIEVNFYDPVVHCNDSEAYHGMDNPILVCTVNHTDLEVKGYAFQIGDTGEIFEPGQDHPKNIVVETADVAPGITVVSLDLYKAEHAYLDKRYYVLIYLEGGHTSKADVRLNKIGAPETNTDGGGGGGDLGDSGVRISSPAFLCVVICAVLWFL